MPKAIATGKVCGSTKCAKVGLVQPFESFNNCKARVDGLAPFCRACESKRNKAYRDRVSGKHSDTLPTPPISTPSFRAPAPAPLPPLENAFAEDQAQREKRDLKSEHKALLAEVDRQRKLLESLKPLHGSSTLRIPEAPAPEKSEAVPLLLISDWHVEEEVDPEKMHGVNAYNLEIAKRRAENYFRNALRMMDLVSRDSLVRRVSVGLLGDLFSNSIHPELMEINQLGPQPAARFAKDLIVAGLTYWLQNSDLDFEINCVGGNHGRMTEKTRIATNAENSLETFAYHFLAAEFKTEKRIKWRIAVGDMLYSDIFPGYRVRFIHGDQIGYGGGVGGLTIPLNKWIARQDNSIRAQLTAVAHFHQRLDGGNHLVNSSLIGHSPYSQRFGFSPEEPSQQFALINWRNGVARKSIVAPIWVD